MLRDKTTTKQEQDLRDIKKSRTRTRKQTEEELKTEPDKSTSHSDVSDNLHQNRNPPYTSEV